MRNDDYEAVEALERALRSAEREIAELYRENKALESSNANLITELQRLQCPTFMGEPVQPVKEPRYERCKVGTC